MKSSKELIFNIVKNESKSAKPLKPINALQEVFSPQAITGDEKEAFFQAFYQGVKCQEQELDNLHKDLDRLIRLSKECHAVQKQGVILLGEKITQAKQIFSSYQSYKPLFSLWIKKTFSSEKTAYNALAYYEFYTEISSDEMKDKLKKMPLKAGYALASRKGAFEDKLKIIEKMYQETSDEILAEIQQQIPASIKDGISQSKIQSALIGKIDHLVDRLESNLKNLDGKNLEKLHQILNKLNRLIKEKDQHA